MPDTSLKAVGQRLIAVRQARGWTQAFMAQLIEESPQRWGHYERGDRALPYDLLAKFWRLTGATSDYVLFGQTYGLPLDLAQALQKHQDVAKKAG